MAKKKKQIVIVDQELTPTVLAVKADKKKTSVFSIVWIVFIFAIFIAAAFNLPTLSAFVNGYLNPDPTTSGSNKPGKNPEQGGDDQQEVIEYNLADNPEIVNKDFTIKNIKVEEGKIHFEIHNNSDKIIDLSTYNYFLNLYNDKKKLLQRIMVSEGVVSNQESTTLSFDLQDDSVAKVSLLEIKEEEYPPFVAHSNENGNATLSCQKDTETVNYLLNNNKVYAIQDYFEVPASTENYAVLYSTYQALAATYSTIGGVTSAVTVENNIMYFRTTVNLNTLVSGSINNKVIYDKDTDAKIMKFELESNGYTCK